MKLNTQGIILPLLFALAAGTAGQAQAAKHVQLLQKKKKAMMKNWKRSLKTIEKSLIMKTEKFIHLIRLNDGVECAFDGNLEGAITLKENMKAKYIKKYPDAQNQMLFWRVETVRVEHSCF